MDKDRIKICNILDHILGIQNDYSKNTVYNQLELYIEEQRLQAIGWCYSHCCVLLDQGLDPRIEEVPKIMNAARKDLE